MPVHDWTPDLDWVFWDFRMAWLVHLKEALSTGVLPTQYVAMIDVRLCPNDRPERRITIHSATDRKCMAVIEIANTRDKENEARFVALTDRLARCLHDRIHVTVIDLLPYGPRAEGLHSRIGKLLGMPKPDEDAMPDHSLCAAGYQASRPSRAVVNQLKAGEAVPPTPLWADDSVQVDLPLEETYMLTFDRLPAEVRAGVA